MRAGRLDRRVMVQRKSLGQSSSGEPIETWSDIGVARWANRSPVSGVERFTAEQFAALEQVEFQLRWSGDISDLQPQDRIIEPATDAIPATPPARSVYDIIGVHEIGRREGLRVLTTRRVDVS